MAITNATGSPYVNFVFINSLSTTWAGTNNGVVIIVHTLTDTVTGIGASKVSGLTQVAKFVDTAGQTYYLYVGKVSSTGSDTITPTYSSSNAIEIYGWELVDSAGVNNWSTVVSNFLNNGSGSLNTPWPSLTSGATGLQAYLGVVGVNDLASPGTTSGFTYTTNGNGDMSVFNGTLAASTAFAPIGVQSTATANTTVGIIVANQPQGTHASAGAASEISTANNPVAHVTANAGVANVTVTANNPTTWAAIVGHAGVANVTVAALNPGVTVKPTAGVAPVTVAGLNPAATVKVTVGVAGVTITANNPAPTVKANAGLANVTIAGLGATPTITASAGKSNVTITANNPTGSGTVTVVAHAGVAQVTVAALAPQAKMVITAGFGTVVVTAHNAIATGPAPPGCTTLTLGRVTVTSLTSSHVTSTDLELGVVTSTDIALSAPTSTAITLTTC